MKIRTRVVNNLIIKNYSKRDHLFWYFQLNKESPFVDTLDNRKWLEKKEKLSQLLKKEFGDIQNLVHSLDERFFYDLNRSWEDPYKSLSKLNQLLERLQFPRP